MAYATKADIQKRVTNAQLVQLTDFDQGGEVDDEKITEALAKATGIIDSYAAGRYTLPLVVSDQVKDLCVVLAVYKLYEGRGQQDVKKSEYDEAMRFLRDVSAAKAQLDQPGKKQASEMDVVKPDHTDADEQEVFDDEKLEGF